MEKITNTNKKKKIIWSSTKPCLSNSKISSNATFLTSWVWCSCCFKAIYPTTWKSCVTFFCDVDHDHCFLHPNHGCCLLLCFWPWSLLSLVLLELLLIIVITFFCVPNHVTLASVEEEKKPKEKRTTPVSNFDSLLCICGRALNTP